MATSTKAKRQTAADIAAAVKIGAIDPSAPILTEAEAAEVVRSAELAAASSAAPQQQRNGTEHECDVPGCRHGAAHGPAQPDRQVKLQCPKCGAVARMTAAAIAKTGGIGILCGRDSVAFAPAARRTYSRRAQ